jgi:hypothetical protein
VQPHNEFRIHPQVVQIGCYWGDGGHTELYLLQGDTLAIVDSGVNDTPTKYIAPALEIYGLTLHDVDLILNPHGHHDHAGGKGELVAVESTGTGLVRLEFTISTRGLIGYRNDFLTETRGLGVMSSRFTGYGPVRVVAPCNTSRGLSLRKVLRPIPRTRIRSSARLNNPLAPVGAVPGLAPLAL